MVCGYVENACVSRSVLYGLSLTIVGTAKGPVQARELRRGAFIFAPKSESGKHQPSHIIACYT